MSPNASRSRLQSLPQNGRAQPSRAATLSVVIVEDTTSRALVGRDGGRYESPPQPHQQAIALAWLLLGCPGETLVGDGQSVCAIAGGRRTVTITPA
jgi:hypothetical protein